MFLSKKIPRNQHRFAFPKSLALVLSLVFIISVGFSFWQSIEPSTDAATYQEIAFNITDGFGYLQDSENASNPSADGAITRPGPAYEYFLAVIFALFGKTLWPVWLAQAFLHMFSAYFVYKISVLLFERFEWKEKAGLVSAFVYGISMDAVLLQSILMTETFFVFLLAGASYFVLKFSFNNGSSSGNDIFFGGLFIGLAIMTRGTALLVLIAALFLLLFQKRYKEIFVFAVLTVIMLAGWGIRNHQVYGVFSPLPQNLGMNLLVANRPDGDGTYTKTPEISEAFNERGPVETNKYATKKYFENVFSHLANFLKIQLKKVLGYFSFARPTGFWPFWSEAPLKQLAVAGFSALFTAFFLIFGAVGAWQVWRYIKTKEVKLFLLFAFLQIASVLPIVVTARHRFPLFIFLAVFSGFSLVCLWRRINWTKVSHYIISFVSFALIAFLDIILNMDKVLSRLG